MCITPHRIHYGDSGIPATEKRRCSSLKISIIVGKFIGYSTLSRRTILINMKNKMLPDFSDGSVKIVLIFIGLPILRLNLANFFISMRVMYYSSYLQ